MQVRYGDADADADVDVDADPQTPIIMYNNNGDNVERPPK